MGTRLFGCVLVWWAASFASGCFVFGSSCEDGGRTWEDGESWICSDGCNHCSCHDGTMTSTAMRCEVPDPDAGALDSGEGGAGGAAAVLE